MAIKGKDMEKIEWDSPAELVEVAANPRPAFGEAGYLYARDGKKLRNGIFMPRKSQRGTIVLMTGYSEFIEKYFETIGDLLARDYCVAVLEWRGHGLSEGNSIDPQRLHLSHFDQNVEDLEDRFDRLVRDVCPPPYFGLAHSMGGQISLRAARRHPDWFAALAHSAPMFGLRLNRNVIRTLRLTLPWLALFSGSDNWSRFDPPTRTAGNPGFNFVTSDQARYERNESVLRFDPRLQVNGRSIGWSMTMFATLQRTQAPRYLKGVSTPLFIGTAGRDVIVDNAAQAHVTAHVQDGRAKTYTGAMHEIMMENDSVRQTFLDDVDAFFTERTSARF